MIINRKLPLRSRRRGLTSFQTSGRTFFSWGLGRDLVRSDAIARPVPREGRSAAFIPWPKLDCPRGEAILAVYACGFFRSRVAQVSSQRMQGSSITAPRQKLNWFLDAAH